MRYFPILNLWVKIFTETAIIIDNDLFKDYTWSTYKGSRVFKQLLPFRIIGEYDQDEDEGKLSISSSFENEGDDKHIALALNIC
ncbi:MAG: hypothetical protein MUO63_20345 [Desulfobulbaceae bacterium]|nr:hypothetical protein [Desulfobulbaceae bacterium]